jgi:hypothetical protein
MDSLVAQARKASRDPRDCREAIDASRFMGFGDEAFRALHHQHGSMAEFYSFSEGVQRFRDDKNNHRVHQRLKYILLSCPDGAPPKDKSFQALAEEAVRLMPPIQ